MVFLQQVDPVQFRKGGFVYFRVCTMQDDLGETDGLFVVTDQVLAVAGIFQFLTHHFIAVLLVDVGFDIFPGCAVSVRFKKGLACQLGQHLEVGQGGGGDGVHGCKV